MYTQMPSFFGFPSGPHRALRRVPCAVQSVLISYLFLFVMGVGTGMEGTEAR